MTGPVAEFLLRVNRECSDITWKNEEGRDKAFVMISGSPYWQLPAVMRNFARFLDADWNFYLFSLANNRAFIEREFDNWDIAKLLGDMPRLDVHSYNLLFFNPEFWLTFKEETLLFAQEDCIACKPLDPEFLKYDFIGAPCGDMTTFNGGLSLRKRSTILECLDRYGPWAGMENEDVFFCKALRQMIKEGNRDVMLPEGDVAIRFSVESFYHELPFGMHGTNKFYISEECQRKIVNQIKL